MPGTVVGTALNAGFPGAIARNAANIIAARQVKPTDTVPVYFGDAVVLNSDSAGGTYSSVAGFIANSGTFTLGIFGGFAIREVKSYEAYISSGTSPATGPTTSFYAPGTACDVIKQGTVSVVCRVGTPTAGGAVYLRVALNGSFPAGIVGGIEAASDGGNTVQLTNCRFFSGYMDGNNVTEVTLLYPATA